MNDENRHRASQAPLMPFLVLLSKKKRSNRVQLLIGKLGKGNLNFTHCIKCISLAESSKSLTTSRRSLAPIRPFSHENKIEPKKAANQEFSITVNLDPKLEQLEFDKLILKPFNQHVMTETITHFHYTLSSNWGWTLSFVLTSYHNVSSKVKRWEEGWGNIQVARLMYTKKEYQRSKLNDESTKSKKEKKRKKNPSSECRMSRVRWQI